MIALSGCDAPVATKLGQQSYSESASSISGITSNASWEAGVFLAGRSGYQCLALEAVGLRPDDEVVSISTSCDCLSPSLIQYATSETAHANGILLQYVDESSATGNDSASQPANLGVLIELTLADGREHKFTVNLLHTHLIAQAPTVKEHHQ